MRKLPLGVICKIAGALLCLLLVVGLAAPYINASKYGERLRRSMQQALNRRVEFRGPVKFSLFAGGFTIEDVVIHEDPSIGLEPIAQMDSVSVRPAVFPLLGGRFEIASIRLEGAIVNLAKTGPAEEWGRWNFSSIVSRSVMHTAPALHVRNGRINFKFGDEKTVFYLLDTDLDITPPSSPGRGWLLNCTAQAGRTDRAAQGLGAFTLRGRWYVDPERVDLAFQLDRARLEEMVALFQGQTGGVYGSLSSRIHLAGPINQIGIVGRVRIGDIYRWDLLPPGGQSWPLDIRGVLDLTSQRVELESAATVSPSQPLWVKFRATDYLSQPHWAVGFNWNHFPVPPLMQLAENLGAHFPSGVKLGGFIDGAVGYTGQGRLQGALALHEASLVIPNSPPVRFEQAQVVLDPGHVRLAPALVRTSDGGQARVEADYALDAGTLDLAISTASMQVSSLRAQVSLAAVPWLAQLRTGEWSGTLRYHREPEKAGWTGDLEVTGAELPVPGLADPIELASAHATIEGARISIDRLRAKAGKLLFIGDYRYEPAAAHPHHLRLRASRWDAADMETELLPTLRRSRSLLARALGRTALPDWLKDREVDGAIQIDHLLLAGVPVDNVHAHMLWNAGRLEFDNLQARVDRAAVSGRVGINIRGQRPAFTFAGKVTGLDWQAGRLDAEGKLETSGFGIQLLANLSSEGSFVGTGLDFGPPGPFRNASGGYSLAFVQGVPRFKLSGLSLRTEDDSFTGHGATQDDGRLLIVLNNGAREMRMSGLLGKLRLEETVR